MCPSSMARGASLVELSLMTEMFPLISGTVKAGTTSLVDGESPWAPAVSLMVGVTEKGTVLTELLSPDAPYSPSSLSSSVDTVWLVVGMAGDDDASGASSISGTGAVGSASPDDTVTSCVLELAVTGAVLSVERKSLIADVAWATQSVKQGTGTSMQVSIGTTDALPSDFAMVVAGARDSARPADARTASAVSELARSAVTQGRAPLL